jgi:hypothetical protein
MKLGRKARLTLPGQHFQLFQYRDREKFFNPFIRSIFNDTQ